MTEIISCSLLVKIDIHMSVEEGSASGIGEKRACSINTIYKAEHDWGDECTNSTQGVHPHIYAFCTKIGQLIGNNQELIFYEESFNR